LEAHNNLDSYVLFLYYGINEIEIFLVNIASSKSTANKFFISFNRSTMHVRKKSAKEFVFFYD